MTLPDAELVARYRAGDLEVFEALYREHAPRVYGLARRMAGSAEAGEDLLQEIFLRAFEKRRSFTGDAAFGTWLYRLALNRCLDHVKSRRARMDLMTEPLVDADRCPSRSPVDDVPNIDLERAIEKLPPGYREAFVLHDVEGFEHGEVARMLGIAEGTSRSQVFKARMKLRALLGSR